MRAAPVIVGVACAALTLLGSAAPAAPGNGAGPASASPDATQAVSPAVTAEGQDLTFAARPARRRATPAQRDTPLSDTVVSGGHTLTYSVGGVSTAPGSGYDGYVRAGATVTFVGALSYTLEDGYSTLLTQRASLGSKGVTGYSGEYVGGGTYTTPFSLAVTAPRTDGEGVVSSIRAEVSGRNCNFSGVCGGPTVSMSFGVLGTDTDTKPPTIKVLPAREPTRIGDQTDVRLRVHDDKGKAKVFATMFSDGTAIMTGKSPGLVRADGDVLKAWWRYPTGETGPFYECYWAKDKAGNTSADAPYSSCQWLSIQVPVKVVSNGCGGSAWGDEVVAILNWIGDTRTYGDITVNQRPACNLHDAGYSGATVSLIRSRELIDYRVLSRDEVDQRFAADLASQCRRAIKDKALRTECIEETYIYVGLVREHGLEVYDADATTAGTQTVVPLFTTPPGGARDNR